MKSINYITAPLFDSTIARFKVTVECRATRVRQSDQSLEKLCYIDQKGNATLKPNIYLVFTYRGETFESNKSLYTSFPQLFKIRSVFEEIKDILLSTETFQDIEGSLEVKQEFIRPIVISEIGKEKKWISFTVRTVSTGDEVGTKVPGVAIEISGPNRETSLLTADEFLTVYSIVKDIDLVQLQVQFGMLALMGDEQPVYGYQQAPVQNYAPQGYSQPYQSAPQYAQRAPQQPRYNNQQRQVAPRAQFPAPQSAPVAPQPTRQMPPRAQAAPIVNMAAIEETEVDSTNWDDAEAINNIFSND